MKFFIFVFLLIALLNVNALSKNSIRNAMTISEADPPNPEDETSFLEVATKAKRQGPPPNSGFKTSLLEGETSAFELFNFYEYTFYVQAYELYNAYVLNTGLSCSTIKKAYWYAKKLDAKAIADFCYLIGKQINSSYLNNNLCPYISGTLNWFNACSY